MYNPIIEFVISSSNQPKSNVECNGYCIEHSSSLKDDNIVNFLIKTVPGGGWVLRKKNGSPLVFVSARTGRALVTGKQIEISDQHRWYDLRRAERYRGRVQISKGGTLSEEILARGVLWEKDGGFRQATSINRIWGRVQVNGCCPIRIRKYKGKGVRYFSVEGEGINFLAKEKNGVLTEIRSNRPINGDTLQDVLKYLYSYICGSPQLYKKACNIIEEWCRG